VRKPSGKKKNAVLGCCLLLTGLTSQAGYAYPTPFDFNHRLLRWNLDAIAGDIVVRVSKDDGVTVQGLDLLVDQSLELWNDVVESRIFMRLSETETPHITVTFQSSISDSSFSAGYAEFDRTKDNGDPEHCRIFVLAYSGISLYSLSKTILHEIGHCIGLGHSLIPEAIMSYHLDRNSFDLDLDDRAAVSRLYPLSGKAALPPGCATGSSVAGLPLVFLWLILGIPLLFCGFHIKFVSKTRDIFRTK